MTDLFTSRRACVVCGCTGAFRGKTLDTDFPILALNVTIYRRARRGTRLATARCVRVCEPCLIRAAAEGGTRTAKARLLSDALIHAVAKKLETMIGDEKTGSGRFRPPAKGGAA